MDENQIYYLGRVEKNTIVLKQNSKPQIFEFVGNIDALNGRYITVANSYSTGALPIGLGGNRYVIIGDSDITETGFRFGIQLAVSFGSNKIAIRNANYSNEGNAKYSDWRYI